MKTVISIIGFGKIGQAFAAHVLQQDVVVHAIDLDESLVAAFNADAYSSDEPGAKEVLDKAYREQRLTVRTTYDAVRESTAVIVCIPLSIDEQKRPLVDPFLECIGILGQRLQPGALLSVETSVPVGFHRRHIEPVIARQGKEHGVDYYLAHSPERIKSGSMLAQLSSLPKVIAGFDASATARAVEIYGQFFKPDLLVPVGTVEEAEFVKMAGMMYRDLNIALANQLASYADVAGIALPELIPLINADKEANLLQPGIGVGGHCTPVYPWFMIDSFAEQGLQFSLALEARKINEGMGRYAVSLVKDHVTVKRALILGLAYRTGVKEDAFSPAYAVRDEAMLAGFDVFLYDPLYTASELAAQGFQGIDDLYGSGATVIFLVTMHQAFGSIDYTRLASDGVQVIVDGRNKLPRAEVVSAGITYVGIGQR